METLLKVLRELGPFYYMENYGNMGDLLIGEGARQFFERYHLPYIDENDASPTGKYNLVYDGGGRFVPYWCDVDECVNLLANENIEKCVILPHSIYGVDEFVACLDERHIVFCRERVSYDYCRSRNQRAQFYLADDMAFHLSLDELKTTPLHGENGNEAERAAAACIKSGLFARLHRGVKRASQTVEINGEKKKVAFLLRVDGEKGNDYSSIATYDISGAWGYVKGGKMHYNAEILRQFSSALKQVDIVVSDRLHACIMAYLSGREVYMLDNAYGKLSGVYQQSLKDKPNVHLLADGTLPPELQEAWKKLNSPIKCVWLQLKAKIQWLYKKLRSKARWLVREKLGITKRNH